MKQGGSGAPRSVVRMLGLLEHLAGARHGMTLAELGAELASPKSSLLALLRPLVAGGYLAHRDGRYALGPGAFRLAALVLEQRRFPLVVREHLAELAERTGESVFLAAIDGHARTVTYVDAIESVQAVRYAVPCGTVRPLYCSAAGLCLLAYRDERWRDAYLDDVTVEPLTEFTVRDAGAIRERCRSIRARGVATSVREAVIDAAGIAAPVFTFDGDVEHAVLVGLPAERLDGREAELERQVKEAAARISYCLAGRAPDTAPAAPSQPARPQGRRQKARRAAKA